MLFTANDAYMRDYHLIVRPTASLERPADNGTRCARCATVLKADITPSTELDLETLRARGGPT